MVPFPATPVLHRLRRTRPTGSRRLVTAAIGLAVVAVLATGCARRPPGSGEANEDTSPAVTAGDLLEIYVDRPEIFCDGSQQQFAELRGAAPRERIVFTSPQPISVPVGVADEAGTLPILWRCDGNEAGLRWEIVATGQTTGNAVAFTIAGTAIDPDATSRLGVRLTGETFTCDATRRRAGLLSGAEPSETIRFSSPQTDNLNAGTADGLGELEFFWSCDPGEAGTSWEVKATGATSKRTVTFRFTGVAPEPDATIADTASHRLIEDPFTCDGVTRPFAEVSGMLPLELVDFAAEPVGDPLRQGQADDDGGLLLRWSCAAEQAGTQWVLTATGSTSGRATTLTFDGVAPGTGTTGTTATTTGTSTSTTVPADPIAYLAREDPFVCDGGTREVGRITNLRPGEPVDFSSPQSDGLRSGTADEDGTIRPRWTCGAGDIDQIWDVTATGRDSGRSITFRIVGGAP